MNVITLSIHTCLLMKCWYITFGPKEFEMFFTHLQISLKKCLQNGEEFPVMLMSSPRTMCVNTLYHEPTSEKMGPLRKVNTLQHAKSSLRRSYTKFKRSSSPGSNNASKSFWNFYFAFYFWYMRINWNDVHLVWHKVLTEEHPVNIQICHNILLILLIPAHWSSG